MIVAVKKNNNQKYIILAIAIFVLLLIFVLFKSFEAGNQSSSEGLEDRKVIKVDANEKQNEAKILEKAIISEVEKVVDLVGQEFIRTIKVIDNKIVIVCEKDAILEALFVRYGAMAMVKKTLNETVLAVDLNYILKSRIYEK